MATNNSDNSDAIRCTICYSVLHDTSDHGQAPTSQDRLDTALSLTADENAPRLEQMTARKYLETASARATEMVENALAGDMDAVRESVQIVRHYVERAITELDRDVAARREIVARLRRTRPN